MNKLIVLGLLSLLIVVPGRAFAETPCNAIGSYVINVEYLGLNYPEQLILNGTNNALTGTLALVSGGLSPWTIDSGMVVGNDIEFEGYFNANPGLRAHFSGEIDANHTISGTWSDVTVDSRSGTWATTNGVANCIQCNVIGSYVINVEYLGVNYPERLFLIGTDSVVTGTLALVAGGLSPWTIDSGAVVGNDIEFEGYFNANPGLRAHFSGKIDANGAMSGTWSDVTVDSRSGTWVTTNGLASCRE